GRQSHRAATTDIDAAAAFRQRVVSRTLRDADMRRGSELKSAADHCAMQDGNHRHRAELNLAESPVPESRMGNALANVSLFQFRQVEARREMFAFAGDQHAADILWQRCEELLDAYDGLVIECIAFLRPIELEHGHAAMPFGGKRGRQLCGKAL